MKRLNNLETFLVIIFIAAVTIVVLYGFIPGRDLFWGKLDQSNGLDAAVLSFGIVGVISLFGIIWIEITRFKSQK